ncbi:MAG: amino acid ABC transporter substrate-binding protein [Gemmatimonadetes bacterium]|nr:amino acid ABC transporter substrate-binding protein [Gemmatimonadota bacterium]
MGPHLCAPIVALLAGLTGCGRERGPIKIGVAFPTRNAAVAFMAADEINATGGVSGRFVQIVRDTIPVEAEPADVEIQRAQSLLARGPLAGVVGHGGSRGSLAAAPVYNDAEVLQIVPTGTSRLLARAGPWTLPLPPNDSVEGAFLADFVRDRLRARSVAIFYVSDEYGVGLRDGVRAALEGGETRVAREQRYDLESDLRALVDAALHAGVPDAIVVAGRYQATAIIARWLAERGVPTRVVAGDGAVVLPDVADMAGAGVTGERIFIATFWLPSAPDTASQRFARTLQQRLLREATASDALIYDAVKLLARAVEEVGTNPERVRKYVLSLGRSRPRYQGVSGAIAFGDAAGPPRLVMGVLRGRSLVPVDSTR